MAEVRDKGPVPLAHPDAKVRAHLDEKTGYLAEVFLDLRARQYALWWQPAGWLPVAGYGDVDLTDWALVVHDGAAKLVGATWQDTSPDGRPHADVIVLAQLY